MKNKFKVKKLELIKLILGGILIISIGYFLLVFKTFFSGVFNLFISVFFVVLVISLIVGLRNYSYKEKIKTILYVILFVLGFNGFYWLFLSVRIESLIYLNVKYNLSYFDMKVVEISIEPEAFSLFDFSKSAIIKYGDIEIYVYYNREWKDDYEEESNKKILRMMF